FAPFLRFRCRDQSLPPVFFLFSWTWLFWFGLSLSLLLLLSLLSSLLWMSLLLFRSSLPRPCLAPPALVAQLPSLLVSCGTCLSILQRSLPSFRLRQCFC